MSQPDAAAATPGMGLEFAFEIRALIGTPLGSGPGRLGHRRVIPITGGTVTGPRLTGEVIPGGADYELIRPDGNSVIEAHYALRAGDGTVIYVRNVGLFVAPAEVIARLDAGAAVEADEYYFRSAPVFDAPDGPQGWLSDRLFVAACRFSNEEVSIRVHCVT
jgi:hypothetical protein